MIKLIQLMLLPVIVITALNDLYPLAMLIFIVLLALNIKDRENG